ncbi:hypothetical protein HOH11_02605 [Candidatus Woesearchaeota archaeon]|jgi:hypothetical protein|nr:hypothetical protein [Candidatus Woesearchaeota archaeon]MBT6023465.1 hypothetical protein [Candidatus Woesearchaeota archaeon]
MKDKIIEFIKENGPSLPVQVVSKIGGDSFIANAYLSELVDSKSLLQSSEKVGSVPLYYLAGQENLMEKKLKDLNFTVKTARTFQKKRVEETLELDAKRDDFNKRLKRIEAEESQRKDKKKSALEKARELIRRTVERPRVVEIPKVEVPVRVERPRVEFQPKVSKPVRPKIERPKDVKAPSFSKNALDFLEGLNVEVLKSEKIKDNSGAFIIRAPSSVGPLKFYVKLWSKKRLNKSDIAESYSLALEKKMPVIILTNGTVAKTTRKYLKEIGGFVRVRALK